MSVSVYLPALKDIRVAKGFTQDALAAAAHITTKTISRIENGESTSIETAKQLAKVLELKSFSQLQSIESTGLFKRFLKEMFVIITSAWAGTLRYLPFFTFFHLCLNPPNADLPIFDVPITLGMVLESAGKCIMPLLTFSLGFFCYHFADSHLGDLYMNAFDQWASSLTNSKYVTATNFAIGLCFATSGVIIPLASNHNVVTDLGFFPLTLLALVYIVGVMSYSILLSRIINVLSSMFRRLNQNA